MGSNSADLQELKNTELIASINKLQSEIDEVEKMLSTLGDSDAEAVYRKLDPAGKAQHDIFLTYALNSLFWAYLRTKGRDAANHAVKSELGRVREHMARAKQLQDRALAPRLDPGVAKRFIRGGLWQPQPKEATAQEKPAEDECAASRPQKRKRGDRN